MPKSSAKNTNPSYVISPCYRLVLPEESERRDERRSGDRRVDTPRGSTVRRPPGRW